MFCTKSWERCPPSLPHKRRKHSNRAKHWLTPIKVSNDAHALMVRDTSSCQIEKLHSFECSSQSHITVHSTSQYSTTRQSGPWRQKYGRWALEIGNEPSMSYTSPDGAPLVISIQGQGSIEQALGQPHQSGEPIRDVNEPLVDVATLLEEGAVDEADAVHSPLPQRPLPSPQWPVVASCQNLTTIV